jgi:NAD(P)-dependent dehydrogenase (short-subunit alcohol dehydrogenase family)
MSSWSGKVAVITGAGSGIGAGLSRHCAQLGMHVVAADIDRAGLEAVTESASAEAASWIVESTDVTDDAQVEALAARTFAEHGRVNLLFNNAGVLVSGKSWERRIEDWQWNLDVNVMGVIRCIRSFVPRMLEQGEAGRVINTASIGGLLGGGAFMGPYQTSKHAVVALTETLYNELELEPAPIAASVLCPGEVATGIFHSDRLRAPEQRNELRSEAERQFHDAVAGSVAEGLTPDEFAVRVFEGIDAGRFWLLPQREFLPMFEMRTKSIVEGTNPPSTAEVMARR